MKVSTQTILRLAKALAALDGELSPDGKRQLYKFAPKVRMAIAKNLARLQEVSQAYQKVRNGLIWSQASGGNTVPPDKLGDFEKEEALLLDELHDVALATISEADLQLEANAIPVTVLAALVPIMPEEATAQPKAVNGAAEAHP